MIRLFDIDIGVGSSGRGQKPCHDGEELTALMDRYGIGRCLAYDLHDVECGLLCGFERILSFCKESDRILPTLNPFMARMANAHKIFHII